MTVALSNCSELRSRELVEGREARQSVVEGKTTADSSYMSRSLQKRVASYEVMTIESRYPILPRVSS